MNREDVNETKLEGGRQRGSALLVSLMVIVGLSLLGLGFVSISETESAISVNGRNYSQTVNVAEAGAQSVVEMFQAPDWADGRGILPPNLDAFKNVRWTDTGSGTTSIGYYKPSASSLLFDKPLHTANGNRFFCTENYPDVLIDRSTSAGQTYLDRLNTVLFADNDSGGKITEIRVYAPPIIGGTPNTHGCIDGGVRYGVATIRATAEKRNSANDLLAQRRVTIVVSEWPFPGPEGPIQSNANISTGGNVHVDWGKMTAQGTMDIPTNKIPTSLPWLDAYDKVPFQYGLDSSTLWTPSTLLAAGDVVHPTAAAIGTTPDLKRYAYTVQTAGTTGASEPTWPDGAGGTITDGTVTYTERPSTEWPINQTGTDVSSKYNWLYSLVGRSWDDPWYQARARGDITSITGIDPQPYQFNDPTTQDPSHTGVAGWASVFQMQDHNAPPNYQEVIFPRMDYDFWKEVAVTANSQTDGVYYLRWVSGENYTDGVTTQNFAHWTNIAGGQKAGFYFFDTQNQLNPQGTGAPGILTPAVSVNSSDAGHDYHAQGFIYLNSTSFGSTGISPPIQYLNAPGEPYQDIGYRHVVESGANLGQWDWDATAQNFVCPPGTATTCGANNGVWDYQDLPWSNGGSTKDGKFNLYLVQKAITRPDGTPATVWVPVPYYPGCTPGDNSYASANCSEPFEPYLNVVYQSTATSGGGVLPLMVGWQDPTAQTRYPKKTDASGNPSPSTCTSSSSLTDCTSNYYDKDGSLVGDLNPMVEGVMYLEGDMGNTGNATFFGSLLINGSVGSTGTPNVWFDEKLVKEEWPPSTWNFPRVYVSSIKTDEQ